jgi:hypothetical protein
MVTRFNNAYDMLAKAKRDLEKLEVTNDIDDFINCMLSLNALPEWIKKDDFFSSITKEKAIVIEYIMKEGSSFTSPNDFNLRENTNHQLRLIRAFCNHIKHAGSQIFPSIDLVDDNTLPMELDFEFGMVLKIGEEKFKAKALIRNIINYWDSFFEENIAN